MPRSRVFFRTMLALVLLGLVAATCISLGNWQLRRAAQRSAILADVAAARHRPPVAITASTPASAWQNWQAATAKGVWLPELTVLLMNRNYKGNPGYWVATPLLLDAHRQTALLVLRGWLPRQITDSHTPPAIPAEPGEQHIEGRLLDHVPRLFELWSFSGQPQNALSLGFAEADAPAPIVQNLSVAELQQATGLQLLPVVLEQAENQGSQHSGTALIRDWPPPSVNPATNRGYAMQWFAFAGIAIVAFLVILWRTWLHQTEKNVTRKETP